MICQEKYHIIYVCQWRQSDTQIFSLQQVNSNSTSVNITYKKKITKELTIIFHSETTILISNPVYTLI